MSSKGQVVIPEEIRSELALKEGAQFVVLGQGDTVILKAIQPPQWDDFADVLKTVRTQAKKAGLKKSDVSDALRAVRRGGK